MQARSIWVARISAYVFTFIQTLCREFAAQMRLVAWVMGSLSKSLIPCIRSFVKLAFPCHMELNSLSPLN